MKGTVSSLYDIDNIVIPDDMVKITVDEQRVQEETDALSKRYAREELTETAEKGDLVYCQADKESYPDDRRILIYPGLQLPGASEAEEALIGKTVGDTVSCELAGKKAVLTVEKILRRTPVPVDDALVASAGIEGVDSISAYKDYIRNKLEEDLKMENGKAITALYIQQMTENSTYEYDTQEMEAHVQSLVKEYKEEATADGEQVTEDEIRKSIVLQEEQNWMVEAFCKEKNLEVDLSSVKEETDQMIEMMKLMGEEIPDREEMERYARQDAFFTAFLSYIDKIVEEKTGGAYGRH